MLYIGIRLGAPILYRFSLPLALFLIRFLAEFAVEREPLL